MLRMPSPLREKEGLYSRTSEKSEEKSRFSTCNDFQMLNIGKYIPMFFHIDIIKY